MTALKKRPLIWHRLLGFILCVPVFIWVITGAVFFIKPGYKDAFELLTLKRYPLETPFLVSPLNKQGTHHGLAGSTQEWLEVKQLRTLLGVHLLVNQNGRWLQLHPETLHPLPLPPPPQLQALLQDAIMHNPKRYGQIIELQGTRAKTSTGVEMTLDWDSLNLSQSGPDTRLINRLYQLHYLQWLPHAGLNSVLGALGLGLLAVLAVTGLWRGFKPRSRN